MYTYTVHTRIGAPRDSSRRRRRYIAAAACCVLLIYTTTISTLPARVPNGTCTRARTERGEQRRLRSSPGVTASRRCDDASACIACMCNIYMFIYIYIYIYILIVHAMCVGAPTQPILALLSRAVMCASACLACACVFAHELTRGREIGI